MRLLAPILTVTLLGLSSGCSLDSLVGAAGGLNGLGGGKLSATFSNSGSNADTGSFNPAIVQGVTSASATTITATSLPTGSKIRTMSITMFGVKAEAGKTYPLSTNNNNSVSILYAEADPTKTGDDAAKGWVSGSGSLSFSTITAGTASFTIKDAVFAPGNASKEATGTFTVNGSGSVKLNNY